MAIARFEPASAANLQRPGRIALIDALRAACCLYVAAYHCIDLMTASGERFHRTAGPLLMLLHGNILGVFGYGQFAVVLFFILSGFSIHLRQARHAETWKLLTIKQWLSSYAARRALRIYPPLLGALIATSLLWVVGSHLFPNFYGHLITLKVAPHAVERNGSGLDFLLVLLPFRGPWSFGTDLPLATIGCELWFYLAYVPISIFFLRNGRVSLTRLLIVSFAISQVTAVCRLGVSGIGLIHVVQYFDCWLVGALLADLYSKNVVIKKVRRTQAAAAVLIALGALSSTQRSLVVPDHLFAMGAATLLAAALLSNSNSVFRPGRAIRSLQPAAKWSYSVYLIHMPIIFFIWAMANGSARFVSNPLIVLGAFVAAVAGALMLYVVAERPSMQCIANIGHSHK